MLTLLQNNKKKDNLWNANNYVLPALSANIEACWGTILFIALIHAYKDY